MSVETYNPNEVAKVKHLLALAESIAEQFGGGTGETPPVDTRPTPTLTYAAPTIAQVQARYTADVAYSGDGNIYVKRISGCTEMDITFGLYSESTRNIVALYGPQATGGTYAICATGTENYKPIEVEFTLE